MLYTTRNDQKLSGAHHNIPVAKLHREPALHHQKQLVFVLVVVPFERPHKLCELYMLAIQLAYDSWVPMIAEESKLLAKINCFHKESLANFKPAQCVPPPAPEPPSE